MNYHVDEINLLIRNRRSMYANMYTGEKIDDRIIMQMLENANWAPTHKHTEPWRFTVFSGGGLKIFADFQAELYKKTTLPNGSYKEDEYVKLLAKPLKASHIISIGMKRDIKDRLPEIEEIEAVACAVQNMYLTAEAYGVGCYWGSGGVTYYEEAKEFFGLEGSDKLMGFFYVGVPKMQAPKGRRSPIEEKVRWVN